MVSPYAPYRCPTCGSRLILEPGGGGAPRDREALLSYHEAHPERLSALEDLLSACRDALSEAPHVVPEGVRRALGAVSATEARAADQPNNSSPSGPPGAGGID